MSYLKLVATGNNEDLLAGDVNRQHREETRTEGEVQDVVGGLVTAQRIIAPGTNYTTSILDTSTDNGKIKQQTQPQSTKSSTKNVDRTMDTK